MSACAELWSLRSRRGRGAGGYRDRADLAILRRLTEHVHKSAGGAARGGIGRIHACAVVQREARDAMAAGFDPGSWTPREPGRQRVDLENPLRRRGNQQAPRRMKHNWSGPVAQPVAHTEPRPNHWSDTRHRT